MMPASVEKIADAVLFEGYILYPYRPSSVKNRQRWNFGTLYARQFAEAQKPEEAWSFHTEMLVEAGPQCTLEFRVRFLQLVASAKSDAEEWNEGLARSRTTEPITIEALREGNEVILDFTSLSTDEKATAPAGFSKVRCVARLKLRAENLSGDIYRLHATVTNESPLDHLEAISRKEAQITALTSAHLIVHLEDGGFVSLLDPGEPLADAAYNCRNQGVFPVLVGEDGDRTTMLCSPIILYDYPQVAAESAGDFFDGTEMDEMLALRVLTLTEDEKEEMRRSDPHAKAILERTETLPAEQLMKVHGAIRGMRPVKESELSDIDDGVQPWNPFEEKPPVECVRVFGMELRKGDRVRLWPQKRADIIDMALEGKVATIEAIEQDLENHIQFAVVLDIDPGRDMGMLRQTGHRFFFSPEEVEPVGMEAQ